MVWSGQWLTAILGMLAWHVLRRHQPSTHPNILFVSAIILGETPSVLAGIFTGYAHPLIALEVLAVLVLGLLLFYKASKTWASALLAHSLFIIFLRASELYQGTYDERFQRIYFGAIALRAIVAWELFDYIRRPMLAIQPPPTAIPHENGNP